MSVSCINHSAEFKWISSCTESKPNPKCKHKMSDDIVTQCCDKASDCIQRGELDKAAKYLKKATDRDPSNGRAIELLTIIAEKKRREEQNGVLLFRSFI